MIKKMFLLSFGLLLFGQIPTVQASELKDNGFQVYSVLPENQVDPNVSYFHIPSAPGKTEKLSVKLENFSDAPKTIQVDTHNALSSPLVNIDYEHNAKTYYSRLLDRDFQLSDHIEIPKEIVLKPHENKVVSFTVSVPDVTPTGELLGAISFEERNQTQPQANGKNEVNVKIQRKYTMAILIQLNDEHTTDVKLTDSSVSVDTGEPLVYTILENHSPNIVKGLKLSYKIKKQGESVYLAENSIALNTFSPKSTLKQPISWKDSTFKAGTYQIDFSLTDANGVLVSEKSNALTIRPKDLEQLIDSTKNAPKENVIVVEKEIPHIYFIAFAIAVLLISIQLLTFFRKRRKKKVAEMVTPVNDLSSETNLESSDTTDQNNDDKSNKND